MFIGINMGMICSMMGSASILALFAGGVVGLWFDPNDRSTLFQDVNATQPITAPGQAVALMRDKSGRGKHATQATAAQRPTYGVIPYGGVRNFAAGSGDVGNATYWPASLTVNGVVYTKVGSGTDTDGLPYVDISVAGTASSTAFFDMYAFANARISAGIGQTYTTSCLAKLIAGATPPVGCGVVVGVVGETAPATITENTASTAIAPSVETQASLTFTFVNAATNQARSSAYIRTGAGLTANYTIRVKALQFEKGSVRTAFQLSMSKYNTTEAGKATVGALFADGIDDGMVTPSIDFSGTDKMTVWAGLQKLGNSQGILAELSPTNSSPGMFNLQSPGPGSVSYRFASGGSFPIAGIADASGYASPSVNTLTGIAEISTDKAILQVNNVQVSSGSSDQGTGNYGNYPIYLFRRGGSTLPFNGIFTGLIVRGAQSSAAQISNGNTYINSTLGAY